MHPGTPTPKGYATAGLGWGFGMCIFLRVVRVKNTGLHGC